MPISRICKIDYRFCSLKVGLHQNRECPEILGLSGYTGHIQWLRHCCLLTVWAITVAYLYRRMQSNDICIIGQYNVMYTVGLTYIAVYITDDGFLPYNLRLWKI